jgi:hypothetical protein
MGSEMKDPNKHYLGSDAKVVGPGFKDGQPVNPEEEPIPHGSPGAGEPSGLVDARAVNADGTLSRQTVAKSLEGQGDDEDESDEESTDYESMTKAQLKAEADSRGLEVTRTDGEDGALRKEDYIAALEEDDASDDEEDEDSEEDEE